jgi:hypothetical protein
MGPRSAPRSSPLPDELERRRRDAIELNDDVVQGLVVARMAVHVGDLTTAAEAIDRTLEAARKIVGQLLQEGDEITPGSLVRHHVADDPGEPAA